MAIDFGNPLLNALAEAESNFRNIPSEVDKDPKGYPGGKSQGYFQIDTPTWRAFGRAEGIDLNKYPNAMSAPPEVQGQVVQRIPLARFGPRTQKLLAAKYGTLDKKAAIGTLATKYGGATLRTRGLASVAPHPELVKKVEEKVKALGFLPPDHKITGIESPALEAAKRALVHATKAHPEQFSPQVVEWGKSYKLLGRPGADEATSFKRAGEATTKARVARSAAKPSPPLPRERPTMPESEASPPLPRERPGDETPIRSVVPYGSTEPPASMPATPDAPRRVGTPVVETPGPSFAGVTEPPADPNAPKKVKTTSVSGDEDLEPSGPLPESGMPAVTTTEGRTDRPEEELKEPLPTVGTILHRMFTPTDTGEAVHDLGSKIKKTDESQVPTGEVDPPITYKKPPGTVASTDPADTFRAGRRVDEEITRQHDLKDAKVPDPAVTAGSPGGVDSEPSAAVREGGAKRTFHSASNVEGAESPPKSGQSKVPTAVPGREGRPDAVPPGGLDQEALSQRFKRDFREPWSRAEERSTPPGVVGAALSAIGGGPATAAPSAMKPAAIPAATPAPSAQPSPAPMGAGGGAFGDAATAAQTAMSQPGFDQPTGGEIQPFADQVGAALNAFRTQNPATQFDPTTGQPVGITGGV